MTLPSQMRAAVLTGFDDPKTQLGIQNVPLPALMPGHVLVRMHAAPINPSDLVFLRNQYGIRKTLPVIPGFEGAGTVVAADAGLYGRWLIGRKVACRAPEDGGGSWAEYMAAPTEGCIPLQKHVPLEQGATLIVNPLTAWALLDRVEKGHHRAFVQTAAASAVGRMILRLAKRRKIVTLNIVRRPEQVDLLKWEGADHILDSSAKGFEEALHALTRRIGTTLALEAVGGPLTAQVADALPKNSKIVVYGALSGEACTVGARAVIFEGKTLTGFWLTEWVKTQGALARLGMARQVQGLLDGALATRILGRFPLEKIHEAIDTYKRNRSDGKALLIL